jgi:hypothetical protein
MLIFMMKSKFYKCLIVVTAVSSVMTLIVLFLMLSIQPFLSLNQPIEAQILVLEGWLPDYALEEASEKISSTNYELVIVTGVPLERGSFLSEYKTYADLGRATLIKISKNEDIIAVSAPPTENGRTYASALALKGWLEENSFNYNRINIISLDAHARRTRHLFKKALGDKYLVGIISIDDINYDEKKWWSTSYGFRTVVDEAIAFVYVIIFF